MRIRVISALSWPKKVEGTGRVFAIGPPLACEPLLPPLLCSVPSEDRPRGDLGPDDRDDPFAKLWEGDCGVSEASLSRRIVPWCLRLRFD